MTTVFAAVVCGVQAANAMDEHDIVGLALTSNVVERMPARDRTTPFNAVLGSVRALLGGQAADVKYHFTDDLWTKATGLDSEAAVSDAQATAFRTLMCDGCATNRVITAFAKTSTNDVCSIEFSMAEMIGTRTETNSFKFMMILRNQAWRVDDLIIDGLSIKADDDF